MALQDAAGAARVADQVRLHVLGYGIPGHTVGYATFDVLMPRQPVRKTDSLKKNYYA